jgi:hypothetical protein
MNAVTGNLVARQLLISPESLTAANTVETVPGRMRPTMAWHVDPATGWPIGQWVVLPTFRQRAEAWQQKAASLPEDRENEAAICLEIAEGYAKLASLLNAPERQKKMSKSWSSE